MNQPLEDSYEYKLYFARDTAKRLMTAIEQLPSSTERTSAHARAEDALGYIQKLVDEQE